MPFNKAFVGSARSAGIDFLRGICVLLVVLHHINLRFKLNHIGIAELLPKALNQVTFWSGYYSVITFFVISGFLITKLSLYRWNSLDQINIRQFYQLRFARIAPCLLLLVAGLSVLHLVQAKEFIINPDRATLGRTVFAALTFHVNWLEGHHGYLPGCWDILWSLSVEEVFYLVFPVLCLCCRRERWLLIPLIALIIIGPFNRVTLADQDPWQDYAYLSCTDGIAFGCIAALLTARVKMTSRVSRLLMALGSIAVLLIVVVRNLSVNAMLNTTGTGISVLEIGIAMILIAVSQGIGNSLFIKSGFIQAVGRSSYEIYLVHMIVILGFIPLIVELQPDIYMTWAWYFALLMLSVVMGWLVRKIYSEPLNKMLRSNCAPDHH